MRTTIFSAAKGASIDNCVLLALRFDEMEFHAEEVESWVVRLGPGGGEIAPFRIEMGRRAWYRGLWRSPTDRLYVAQATGLVHVSRLDGGWDSHSLPFIVGGVWGLNDDCVFAWGIADRKTLLWQWNGKEWREFPSPGKVEVMGGVSADSMLAVGGGGLVARWDGSAWTHLPLTTAANFGALHVVNEGEAYAANRAGELYEISADGIGLRLQWGAPFLDIAKFQDSLWLATGDAAGLYRVPARTREMLHVPQGDNTMSLQISGDRLLMRKPRALCDTIDFQEIRVRLIDFVEEALEEPQERD